MPDQPSEPEAAATPSYPIFDGHNDALLSLSVESRGHGRSFFVESEHGHLDLPRAARGGYAGGFFAVFVPNREMIEEKRDDDHDGNANEDEADWATKRRQGALTLPEPLDFDFAHEQARRLVDLLFDLESKSQGALRIVRAVEEIEENFEARILSAILHFEGAEPIKPDLSNLESWYDRGLRSIGLVWSRGNAFAEGVPFRCPGSPDTGPGLTDAGQALVKACNAMGIMLDLSHLNERGFRDVAKISTAPLVATHSCAHAICPSTRNLTDEQLAMIRDSDGLVGLNFFVGDVRADGAPTTDTPLEHHVKQIDYLVEKLGIERVAFGSDFDGATMPKDLKDAAHLPNLIDALRRAGYDDEALAHLAHRNWLRILRATWRAA